MKKIIFSLLGVVSFVAISCANPQPGTSNQSTNTQQEKATFKNVKITDLKKAMDANEDIIILDVRTPGEVAQGYVTNAKIADVNGGDFNQKVANMDKSKTVYVYCRSGHRSQKASNKLLDLGFTDVRNVTGGFMAWEQAGYPKTK